MTKRLPCPPAPGPLEEYAERFDDRLGTLAQRRGFREYLQGLLLPRDRHKTLTGLVGTEPVVGAQAPSVQRLQFFLSESPWDAEAINRRRLELVVADPATAPHDGRGAGDRRQRRSEGRHQDRARRPPVPGLDRQDRRRDRRGHQPLGRRAGLLSPARQAVHAGRAAAEGQGRSGLPHQAPARGGAGRRGPRRRVLVPRGRGRLLLRRERHLRGCPGRGRPALRRWR